MSSEATVCPGNEASLETLLNLFYEQKANKRGLVLSRFRDAPDAQVFPVLEQALRNHDNANQRNAAMELYAGLGNKSLPHLAALLKDNDEEIRTFAGVILGNMRHPDAVPDLLQALVDPDLNVKHAAAEALGKIKDPRAVDPLIDILHSDMWLQFPAAVALGDIGDPRAMGPLIALLDIPGANIPAIQALGKLGHIAALEPLSVFLNDEEPSLREWALEAVARLFILNPGYRHRTGSSSRTADILIATLQSESLKARRNAVLVLGRYRERRAATAIAKLLPDRELREDALEALIRIGDEAIHPELVAYTRDSDVLIRRAAIRTLAGLKTERSFKAVLPLLSDPAEDVRAEAMLALTRFDSEEARKALARMMADLSGSTAAAQKLALQALTTIGPAGNQSLAFDPADLMPLRDHIAEKLGLFYDNERLHVLYHRLSPVAAAGGHLSFKEMFEHLTRGPVNAGALPAIASQLTNNETYFFREKEQLQVFDRVLVPELVRRKLSGPQKKIRILSAGCSSGEEAYTIAMLLEEQNLRSQGCEAEIVGVDIDPAVLETARAGRYAARSFRREKRGLEQKYFRSEKNEFVVEGRIRNLVTFKRGNLLEIGDLDAFDVIFCRNVLIYFSDNAIARAVRNFYDLLLPNGYLLLGHSESLCRIETEFVPLRLKGAVIYQKS